MKNKSKKVIVKEILIPLTEDQVVGLLDHISNNFKFLQKESTKLMKVTISYLEKK